MLQSAVTGNDSALMLYQQQLNTHAAVREYLIVSPTRFIGKTAHHIALQAAALALLTHTTNQLTRSTAVRHVRYSAFSPLAC